MLENVGSMTRSRASTSVCRARAMRPLPSLNGWIITRFRCAIAARTSGSVSASEARSVINASTSFRSYGAWRRHVISSKYANFQAGRLASSRGSGTA